MNNQALISKVNKMPEVLSKYEITAEEFDSILMDPNLSVVEKHFHYHNETNQVLFVIKDGEIDFVAVKEITDEGTYIYKELN